MRNKENAAELGTIAVEGGQPCLAEASGENNEASGETVLSGKLKFA